jgi:hypothetical protein
VGRRETPTRRTGRIPPHARAASAVISTNVRRKELHHVHFVRNEDSLRFAFGVFALASLCATAHAQSEIKVLSSRPDSVSGGDAVIQVRVAPNVSVLQVVGLRNGVDVTGAFVAKDLTTLQGLVGGLNVGTNVILVKMRSDGSILTKAIVQN